MTKRKAKGDDPVISERAQHFLKVLVEHYILDGEPVGSRTLAKGSGLDLSPATIRNVLADLEELGLVSSPHTSAGRVPTVSGYRFFVDSLVSLKSPSRHEMAQLKRELASEENGSRGLVQSASQLLSGLTHMAGVVMMPKRSRVVFRQLEFLPLSGNRVLAILVSRDGEVHNRVISTRRVFSPAELQQAANLLNQEYAGLGLEDMHRRLLKEMQETRDSMNRVMARALEIAEQIIDPSDSDDDFVLAGQTNLMDFSELAQMDRLRQLFDSFNEKSELLHLLDVSMNADGVQLYIGEESRYQPFDSCTLVTAPYQVDGEVAGVLGVIGPTRMAYDRVIPIVDVTAKILGSALKQR